MFARPWATPSRLSHEDQHKSSLDDGELGSAGLSPRKVTPKESKITLFDERVQHPRVTVNKTKQQKKIKAIYHFVRLCQYQRF